MTPIRVADIPPEDEKTHLIERPDGFYWQYRGRAREFGPFATLIEAQEDMRYSAEGQGEPGASLLEAEDELGIADWIDPDTGEPAEDGIPHIVDR